MLIAAVLQNIRRCSHHLRRCFKRAKRSATVLTVLLYKYTLHCGAVIYARQIRELTVQQRSKIHFIGHHTSCRSVASQQSTPRLQCTSLQYLAVMLKALTRCPGYPVRTLAGKYNSTEIDIESHWFLCYSVSNSSMEKWRQRAGGWLSVEMNTADRWMTVRRNEDSRPVVDCQ